MTYFVSRSISFTESRSARTPRCVKLLVDLPCLSAFRITFNPSSVSDPAPGSIIVSRSHEFQRTRIIIIYYHSSSLSDARAGKALDPSSVSLIFAEYSSKTSFVFTLIPQFYILDAIVLFTFTLRSPSRIRGDCYFISPPFILPTSIHRRFSKPPLDVITLLKTPL